ncbi:MAG: hypothetical protein ABJB74_06920 [Gemmatimonas sp.]
MLELGAQPGSIEFSAFGTTLARDSKGRIYVAPVNAGTGVAVYDSLGTLLQVLGGKGSALGMFQQVTAIDVSLRDTLVVFDSALHQLVVFDPQLKPVRAVPLRDDFTNLLALQSGAVGLLGSRSVNGSAEFPFHRYDGHSGVFERSFGDSLHIYPDAGRERLVLSVDETPSGDVWMMNPMPVRISRFDTEGKRVSEFLYQPSWMPSVEQSPRMLELTDSVIGTLKFIRQIPAQPGTLLWQARVMPDERVALLLGGRPKRGWEARTNPYLFDSAAHAHIVKSYSSVHASVVKSDSAAHAHVVKSDSAVNPPLGKSDPAAHASVMNNDSASRSGARINNFNGWYDSVVEAVDMNTGKSLGTITLPFSGNPQLLRGGYLATRQGNPNGTLNVIIWSFTIPAVPPSR